MPQPLPDGLGSVTLFFRAATVKQQSRLIRACHGTKINCSMNGRLLSAMAAYALLAVLAGFTLDGKMRLFIWILMGALAIKTYAAHRTGM